MRSLRKINKGAILTIIVLLVLIIYIVCQEVSRAQEKENIKKSCEEYIEFMDKYSTLKEQYQTIKPSISDEELKKYIEEFKNELKQYAISNENVIDIQAMAFRTNIEEFELSGNSVTTKFDRQVKRVKKYVFDGDQVTVTLENEVKKEVKTLDVMTEEEQTENKEFNSKNDEITLKKKDGKWKVVYANLQYISNDEMSEDMENVELSIN